MKIRLRELRKKAGMTQKEFAASIGVSWTALKSYESGETSPTADKLCMMCDVLKTTPNEMLDWRDGDEDPDHEMLIDAYDRATPEVKAVMAATAKAVPRKVEDNSRRPA